MKPGGLGDHDAAPRIVCLLAVRNGAATLSGWLDEANAFADAVVALDDGSTDATGAILAAHPLVATVLTNNPREGYLGWHDGRNRNRLLAAAAELHPDWIFSLDADERLDPSDAHALRRFVATDALAACAYGFQVYRMSAGDTYDPRYEWVFRLFAFNQSHRFLNRRLDLVPVPATMGPERWLHTTLRIKHYGEVDDGARERRIAKFREADPEGAFRDYYENLQPASPGPYPRWMPRPAETPFLMAARTSGTESGTRPYVVCLLPARNCAQLLPGWFESISRVADAVVALDDGSTDETCQLLEAHPLVVRVLTNPRRPAGFHDWDDGFNRNRLLSAAGELSPTWVISVDADERIPLDDAAALRRFLHDGAEHGYGYALASYRMIGDEDHYDRLDYDAYRLFAFEPGHVFPPNRLHAPPIPTAIPAERWRQTTIRMKHLVSMTEAARNARYEKFREADPDCVWEPDYSYTSEAPGPLKVWETRPLARPVLVHGALTPAPSDDLDLSGPILTVALTVDPGQEDDAVAMMCALGAAVDDRVELLALTRDGYAATVLKTDVPNVTVVEIAPELTDTQLRNRALDVAQGDYVTFLFVGDEVDGSSFDELIDAHEGGHGALKARLADAPTTAAGWAAALLSEAERGSVFTSFVRERLRALGGFEDCAPEELDARAGRRLLADGFTTAPVASIVRRRRTVPRVGEMLRQRYDSGRRSPHGLAPTSTTGALQELRDLDGSLDSSRVAVASIIVAATGASWLGRSSRRSRRS